MADIVIETTVKPASDTLDGCVSSKAEKKSDKVAENGNSTPAVEFTVNTLNGNTKKEDADDNSELAEETEPELYFTPKVSLPLVDVNTLEDNEEVFVELRSRIYRFDDSEDEPELKERGTGVVKILRHKETGMYRILLRRDKTHKICANHYITSSMELSKHNNSEKVFVYSTLADLYDGETNPETFAIRFSGPENATIFKTAFYDALKEIKQKEKEQKKAAKDVDQLTQDLKDVKIKSKK